MKIIMKKSMPGSVDGMRVSHYVDGVEYDLGGSPGETSLAEAFVASGVADEVAGATAPVVHRKDAEAQVVEPVTPHEQEPATKPARRKK